MSEINSVRKLRHNEQFYCVDVDNEVLLYQPTSQRAVHLDPIAALIWKLCDGTRSADEVATELTEQYPESAEAVRSDVMDALATLIDGNAVIYLD